MPHHVASLPSAGSQARTQLNVPAVTTARTISSLRVNVRSVQLIVLLSIACFLCLRLSTELIRIGTSVGTDRLWVGRVPLEGRLFQNFNTGFSA